MHVQYAFPGMNHLMRALHAVAIQPQCAKKLARIFGCVMCARTLSTVHILAAQQGQSPAGRVGLAPSDLAHRRKVQQPTSEWPVQRGVACCKRAAGASKESGGHCCVCPGAAVSMLDWYMDLDFSLSALYCVETCVSVRDVLRRSDRMGLGHGVVTNAGGEGFHLHNSKSGLQQLPGR